MNDFQSVIDRMIAESGAKLWAQRGPRDHTDPVTVTDNPSRCFRLFLQDPGKPDQWSQIEEPLNTEEVRQFFVAFGSHWIFFLGAHVGTGLKIRAFIKNGRKPGDDWSISTEKPEISFA